jgi:4-amino-4-deoxy-L-arabinose transferase-like glycosyltransferase
MIYGLSAKVRNKEFIFVVFWFIVIFVSFSLFKAKRELYLLPLYPAASLMVGYLLAQIPLGTKDAQRKLISIPFFVLIIVLALTAISLPIVAALKGRFYLEHPWEISVVSALIAGGATLLAFLALRYRRRYLPFYIIVAMVFVMSLYGAVRIFPEINRYKSARPLSQAIVSVMKPGDLLGTYQLEAAHLIYYTGYNQMRWFEEEGALKEFLHSPQRVLCIMRERHYKRLEEDPTLSISVVATGQIGHKHLVVISNRQGP